MKKILIKKMLSGPRVIASVSKVISVFIRDCHVVLKTFRTPRNDSSIRTLVNIYLINVIIGSVLVLVLNFNCYAAGPGTTAASFLKIGVGARASAMGDAFTAIADNPTALYWNPAGLIKIKERQLSATYNMWFAEISHGYAGIGFPLAKGALGGAINYLSMGDIEERDEAGNLTGSFGASDFDLSLGYAREFGDKYIFGLSGGIVQDTIAGDSKTAFLASLGGLFEVSEFLTLGVAFQNIGTNLGNDPLPFIIKGGLAFKRKSLTLAMDLAKPTENKMYFCAGAEWWIWDIIALRAGYKTNQDIGAGFTAGIGFKKDKIQLDYAYVPYGELGSTHRVSFGMRF